MRVQTGDIPVLACRELYQGIIIFMVVEPFRLKLCYTENVIICTRWLQCTSLTNNDMFSGTSENKEATFGIGQDETVK